MISIISYNVGIQSSMWQKHVTAWTKPGRFRTQKVIEILAQHEPDLMCLQEMGMHEEGLPPDEVIEVFKRDAQKMTEWHAEKLSGYVTTTTGPYTIMSKRGAASVVHSELRPACDLPDQEWRRVQHTTVQLGPSKARTCAHSEFCLVNLHLASSDRTVTYRADYGRGQVLGSRKHRLTTRTREATVRKWLSHAACPTIVAGDFNIDDMVEFLRGTPSPQSWTLWPPQGKKDFILCSHAQRRPHPLTGYSTPYMIEDHVPIAGQYELLQYTPQQTPQQKPTPSLGEDSKGANKLVQDNAALHHQRFSVHT